MVMQFVQGGRPSISVPHPNTHPNVVGNSENPTINNHLKNSLTDFKAEFEYKANILPYYVNSSFVLTDSSQLHHLTLPLRKSQFHFLQLAHSLPESKLHNGSHDFPPTRRLLRKRN